MISQAERNTCEILQKMTNGNYEMSIFGEEIVIRNGLFEQKIYLSDLIKIVNNMFEILSQKD